ncbi:hypothetical protein ACIBG8_08765 [Nonomuraea sp. NPDC050556]|uniref:hypothetical protein n=1 Tax=Nonomuraea sp. NPDC050556 TaxID=3364369 RepID=UPI00379B7DD6
MRRSLCPWWPIVAVIRRTTGIWVKSRAFSALPWQVSPNASPAVTPRTGPSPNPAATPTETWQSMGGGMLGRLAADISDVVLGEVEYGGDLFVHLFKVLRGRLTGSGRWS